MNFVCSENNSKLISRLEKAVCEGKISHAYIFEGPSNMNKIAFAQSFIKGVLCPEGRGENCGKCAICEKIDCGNHEDITYVEKDGRSVKEAAVSLIQDKVNVKPFGDRNIIVLSDCDTMTPKALNSLLKTLEEPPGNSMLILLSENMETLAQTILSRCVKYRLEAGYDDIADGKIQKIVEMILEGKPFYALCNETQDYIKDREKAVIFLDSIEQVYRKYITVKQRSVSLHKTENICDNIEDIENARKQVMQGMKVDYVLKNLFLALLK